ncbi:MAG TPA: DinB family protein [Bryobacteraceae bacterium]|nr:DinB family protein [Bryobacteraceae bacterium]
MSRLWTVTFLTACFAVAALNAQDNPFSADAKGSYVGIKNTITRAADKMPEANYSFRPVPEVRTYGEIIGHIADIQVMLCSLVKGEQKAPVSTGKTSKADLAAALKESFDYCDGVYNSMTDAIGAQKVKMFGREQTKLGVLNFNTMHDNEMYGTAVAYLRMKGIVPPSSERRP